MCTVVAVLYCERKVLQGALFLDDEKARVAELNKEKRALKIEINDKKLAAQDVVKSIKEDNLKEAAKLQQDFDQQAHKLRQN